MLLSSAEDKFWALPNCWKGVFTEIEMDGAQSEEETWGWRWGQSCPEGMITSWAKRCDRKAQGGWIAEEMMERLQGGEQSSSRACACRFTLRFVLDHHLLSILMGSSKAKTCHSSSYCLKLINLDWVGWRNMHWRGRAVNVCDTRGVIFGANCVTFYQTCLPSHLEPGWEQRRYSPHQRVFPWKLCQQMWMCVSAEHYISSPLLELMSV